jgi:hypothetical protein
LKAPKIPKHLKQAARRARAQGWTIELTGKGHLKWSPPRGQAVMTGSTPKRYGHGPRNEQRAFAKAGLGAKR